MGTGKGPGSFSPSSSQELGSICSLLFTIPCSFGGYLGQMIVLFLNLSNSLTQPKQDTEQQTVLNTS